jgi:hypothetical protein
MGSFQRLVLMRMAAYDVEWSMADAQVRANWPKFIIRCAKRLVDPNGVPVVDAVPAELRREIREAGRLAWEDARLLMDLAEQIREKCGAPAARAFWRASFLEAITQPMMAPLARGALMLWGSSPDALVRRTPQAWQLMTRGCGQLKAVSVDEKNAIILRAESLPRMFRVEGFACMGEGGLESEMDYFRLAGTVETRAEHLVARGTIDFLARWSERP